MPINSISIEKNTQSNSFFFVCTLFAFVLGSSIKGANYRVKSESNEIVIVSFKFNPKMRLFEIK